MSGRADVGAPTASAYLASAALHALVLLAAFIGLRNPAAPVVLPPMYHVELVAAPAGERAIGEVKTAQPVKEKPITAPRPSESSVKPMPVAKPVKAAEPVRRATPGLEVPKAQVKSNAPVAGGGTEGGRGTDVVNFMTQGIEFPFPGYLSNIVRQIALNYKPRDRKKMFEAGYRAIVFFMIHRDGTVTDFKFLKRSGNYAFDLDVETAVTVPAKARAFGPLPAAFADDVFPVYFKFDPDFVR